MKMDRRSFLVGSATAAAVPGVASASDRRDVVVYVSAHPDDLAGSIGTVIRLRERFDVHVVDYTRGERGLGEAGYRDGSAARLRVAEEERICREIGVTLHWCDEIDGEAFAGRKTCEMLADLYRRLKPRAIIAHWPLDTHADHLMSAAAAIKAAQLAGIYPEMYFHEQNRQSRGFPAAYYVDVSQLSERRRRLISMWACQGGPAMAERKSQASVVNGGRVGMREAEIFALFPGTLRSARGIFDEMPNVLRT